MKDIYKSLLDLDAKRASSYLDEQDKHTFRVNRNPIRDATPKISTWENRIPSFDVKRVWVNRQVGRNFAMLNNEKHEDDKKQEKHEKPLDIDEAISEIELVTKEAKKLGITIQEFIDNESRNGNTKPQDAVNFLRKEQERLNLNQKEVAESNRSTSKNVERRGLPPWVKDAGKELFNLGISVILGIVVGEVSSRMLREPQYNQKLGNAKYEFDQVSERAKLSGRDVVPQIALEDLSGNPKPSEALHFLQAEQAKLNDPLLQFGKEAGKFVLSKLLYKAADYGVRKLGKVIWTAIKSL